METPPTYRNIIALAILALLLPLSFLGGYQLGEIVTAFKSILEIQHRTGALGWER